MFFLSGEKYLSRKGILNFEFNYVNNLGYGNNVVEKFDVCSVA